MGIIFTIYCRKSANIFKEVKKIELKRRIYLKVYGDGTVLPSSDILGYIGEHLATEMVFILPDNLIDNEYIYTINFEDDAGNINVGCMTSDSLSFIIPAELTTTNKLKAELVITNSQGVIFKSCDFLFNIHNGVSTDDISNKYVGLLEDTLSKFNAIIKQIGTDDLSKLRGITSIEKTQTNENVDTYTISYTDNTTSNFNVTNGKNGTDYVLTSEDKAEISQIVFDSYISDINATLEERLNGGESSGNT